MKRSYMLSGVLLLGANVTYWMIAGAYTPFLSSYFTSIGLSATEVGVLLSVSPLAVILVQPFWARLSDATGKRKLVLGLLAILSSSAALIYYVGTTYLAVFAATVAFSLFFSALLPLCDALVIEGCGETGHEFAYVRMGGTCGYAFVVFVVGNLLDERPEMQFALVSVLCLVFLAFVAAFPVSRRHEGAAPAPQAEPSDGDATVVNGVVVTEKNSFGIFRSSEILYILAFALVSQVGLGFLGSFMGRYCVELGFGQGFVGVLNSVSALSELPILLFAGVLVARFGEVRILTASCVLMALRLVLVGTGSAPVMVVGQLLQSVTYMTVYYCCTVYVSRNVLPGFLSQGQSIFVMVQSGVAMMISNLAGGAVGDALGTRAGFFLSAGLVLIGTVAVVAAYRRAIKGKVDSLGEDSPECV